LCLAALNGLLLAALAAASADTRPADTHPAAAPATGPSDVLPPTLPATRPTFEEILPARTVEEALDYTEDEEIILSDVALDDDWDSAALYVLLRRAAMLPTGREVLQRADRPYLKNLWDEPDRYRGRLVRLEGRYTGKTENKTDLARRTHRWPYPRPVWIVHVSLPVPGGEAVDRWPALVIMGRRPPELKMGQRVEMAALFYKIVRLEKESGTLVKGEYPVFVAREILPPRSEEGGVPLLSYLIAGLIAVLLLAFYFLKTRARRAKIQRADHGYRPLRFELPPEEAEQTESDPEQLDPELRKQAGDYLREHPEEAKDRDEDEPR
jgi:hypothetical protein